MTLDSSNSSFVLHMFIVLYTKSDKILGFRKQKLLKMIKIISFIFLFL